MFLPAAASRTRSAETNCLRQANLVDGEIDLYNLGHGSGGGRDG
jgi:hypothetical protein